MIVMQSESATKLHQMSNGLLSVSSSMNGVMTSSPSPSSLTSAISAPVTTATVKKMMVDKPQVLHDVKKKEAGVKARRSSVKTESRPKINMASLPNGVATNGFTPPFTGSTPMNHKTVAKRAVDPENGASAKKRTKKKSAVEAVHEMILSATKSTSAGKLNCFFQLTTNLFCSFRIVCRSIISRGDIFSEDLDCNSSCYQGRS